MRIFVNRVVCGLCVLKDSKARRVGKPTDPAKDAREFKVPDSVYESFVAQGHDLPVAVDYSMASIRKALERRSGEVHETEQMSNTSVAEATSALDGILTQAMQATQDGRLRMRSDLVDLFSAADKSDRDDRFADEQHGIIVSDTVSELAK